MDGEIVGLRGTTNDRKCESHTCFGDSIKKDSVIRFKLTAVDGKTGIVEKAIKAIRISDGRELCLVAYLPQRIMKNFPNQFNGKFAQIIELYDLSDNSMMRRKSKRNQGSLLSYNTGGTTWSHRQDDIFVASHP